MLTTVAISFAALSLFGIALALGQFFGREPIAPKCNPGTCCLEGRDCKRRKAAASTRD